MGNEEILVSVMCIAYNHEKFIAKSLDSLVNQKTNFRYEVLVHDDCSTDKTAQIIDEYEKKNPAIVKAYYEEENQYSKKVSNFLKMAKEASGKYLAICEGDDFWLNENKLQEQVDYIEAHPNCTMCITAAQLVNIENKKVGEIHPFLENGEYGIPEYLKRNSNIPTASILVKTKDLIEVYNMPYRKVSYVGDVPISLYMFSNGNVYYKNSCDVAYRINNPESWVGRTKGEKYIPYIKNSIETHMVFDEYTNGKYSEAVKQKVRECNLKILISQQNFSEAITEYPDLIKEKKFKQKVYIYIGAYAPWLLKLRKNLGR